MKRKALLKYIIIGLVVAGALFFIGFSWERYRSEARGPWVVVFLTDQGGSPFVIVSQDALRISQKIVFSHENLGRANVIRARRFDAFSRVLPFGKLLSLETSRLPGTAVFDFFGHEVKLTPQRLRIDKKEYMWRSTPEITIRGAAKKRISEPGSLKPKQHGQ